MIASFRTPGNLTTPQQQILSLDGLETLPRSGSFQRMVSSRLAMIAHSER
jgi:hypothetical protein